MSGPRNHRLTAQLHPLSKEEEKESPVDMFYLSLSLSLYCLFTFSFLFFFCRYSSSSALENPAPAAAAAVAVQRSTCFLRAVNLYWEKCFNGIKVRRGCLESFPFICLARFHGQVKLLHFSERIHLQTMIKVVLTACL